MHQTTIEINFQSYYRRNKHNMSETSEKERRIKMIQEEFDQIIKDADNFCLEHLEEEMEPEAVEALKKAANKVSQGEPED